MSPTMTSRLLNVFFTDSRSEGLDGSAEASHCITDEVGGAEGEAGRERERERNTRLSFSLLLSSRFYIVISFFFLLVLLSHLPLCNTFFTVSFISLPTGS